MKLAFVEPEIKQPLLELLRPWSFSVTTVEDADVVLTRGSLLGVEAKAIVISNDSAEFSSLIKSKNLGLPRKEKWRQVQIPVTENLGLAITPENVYSYGTSENFEYAFSPDSSVSFLGINVVAEYYRIVNETFNAKPSSRYRLFTSLPIPYTNAPKRLRDLVMAQKVNTSQVNYSYKLPLDALRFTLVGAIQNITGEKMELKRELQRKRKTAFLITHDVDTREGLNRALRVKKIEEKYDVGSAWYVPSNHFTLDSNVLAALANHGEMGAHDTKHDGKLAGLRGPKLAERLQEAKRTLEEAANCSIRGFRAPLLQHTFAILEALPRAAYAYDSSTPTFEPNYPRTMGPHGLGTVFPIKLCGTLEIPITIIQDHQLLYAQGLKPAELIAFWDETAALIKSLGGCCVTLSHPEYKLFDKENLASYENFLSGITSDEDNEVTTPDQIAREDAMYDAD